MPSNFKRGARVRSDEPAVLVCPPPHMPTVADLEAAKKRVIQREAFAIAKANKRKPWARRFLRQTALNVVDFGKGNR